MYWGVYLTLYTCTEEFSLLYIHGLRSFPYFIYMDWGVYLTLYTCTEEFTLLYIHVLRSLPYFIYMYWGVYLTLYTWTEGFTLLYIHVLRNHLCLCPHLKNPGKLLCATDAVKFVWLLTRQHLCIMPLNIIGYRWLGMTSRWPPPPPQLNRSSSCQRSNSERLFDHKKLLWLITRPLTRPQTNVFKLGRELWND